MLTNENIKFMSAKGICYSLEKSPYRVNVSNFTYFFSSKRYADKFRDNLAENREMFKSQWTSRMKIHFESDTMADIQLYQTIEKRGFYVTIDGEEVHPWQLRFVGEIKIN